MAKTEYFWTDVGQAQERLIGSVIMYEDYPVYVRDVTTHEDGIPRVHFVKCSDSKGEIFRKMANSPKFHRYRLLPSLGWFNMEGDGRTLFVDRRVVSTRTHGIYAGNTVTSSLVTARREIQFDAGNRASFDYIWPDPGFSKAQKNEYPSMASILQRIKDGSAIAYSLRYCIIKDFEGMIWLYRNLDKVGLIIGNETLYIISSKAYLREEIMEDPAFSLTSIREF